VDPVLFQIGPFTVRWYGLMMAATIISSLWAAARWGPRFGVPRAQVDRIVFWLVVLLFVGARAGYVLSHPAEFSDPREILRIWHGGLSSHGALVAGLLYVWAVARRTGISVWSLADTFAWPIPLGNLFVRFGNFMNGELYGDPTTLPWGIRFPLVPDGPRHPLQVYEMALAVVILLVAWRVAARRSFPGQVWWLIVVLTSLGRIALDALRREDHVLWGLFAYGQIAAAVLLVIGLVFLARGAIRSGSAPRTPLGADANR